jgi:hypothetical protein
VGELQIHLEVVTTLFKLLTENSNAFLAEQWVKKMEGYRGWFKEQESVKADESKRPGKPKTHDDLFGLEGSFRQLVID